jgi:Ribosomal proteins 50S L24/mitochondrial 39S L24
VALVCPTDGRARLGYRVDPGGARVRICKKCGTEL